MKYLLVMTIIMICSGCAVQTARYIHPKTKAIKECRRPFAEFLTFPYYEGCKNSLEDQGYVRMP